MKDEVGSYSPGYVRELEAPPGSLPSPCVFPPSAQPNVQLDQAAGAGISVPMDVPVGDQVQKMRVMVLDPKLQGLGSVTISDEITQWRRQSSQRGHSSL